MTSFVHDRLAAPGQLGAFDDNRPKAVRHFEDAARIIGAEALLPVLSDYDDARSLADDLLRQRQIAALPRADDVAFALSRGARTDAIRAAHAAIAPTFWGPRIALDDACSAISAWIKRRFEPAR
jgi:hypothetical protein